MVIIDKAMNVAVRAVVVCMAKSNRVFEDGGQWPWAGRSRLSPSAGSWRRRLLGERLRLHEAPLDDPGCPIHGVLGRIEDEDVQVRRDLELVPRNRNVTLAQAEDAAAGDDEVGDLAALRSHDDVVDAPERDVFRGAHFAP